MSLRSLSFFQKRFILGYFIILLVTNLLSGCSFGPKQLKDGHLAYNETVRLSSDQELLLNIVRLRYLDTIEFMSISSISSQLSFSVSVGGSIDEETSLGFGEAAWSSRPTFTFTPQRGRIFAKMVTTPVPVSVMTDLAAADWDIPILFQLLTRDVNGHENISGLISDEFLEFTQLLGDLQSRTDLYFGSIELREKISDSIPINSVSGSDLVEAAKSGYRFELDASSENYTLTQALNQPVLYIPKEVPERNQLLKLLHIRDLKNEYVELRPGKFPEEALDEIDFIMVEMRSIFDTIAYLAGGVEVPEPHITKGLATADWPMSGFPTNNLKSLLHIHVSENKPGDSLAIQHRGYWFYLADNDTRSKLTFLTLAEIMRMALSPSEDAKTPVLTLPVGR
jgi:hypothetical protein